MSALTGAQLGLMTGSFLSGCLLSIPLLSIPTITNPTSSPTAPILLSSWSSLYKLGAASMPPLATLTASLYGWSAYKLRSSTTKTTASTSQKQKGKVQRWKLFTAATFLTLYIMPFTLIVMLPTNKALMRLNEMQIEPGPLVSNLQEVRELVSRWNWLHIGRSLGPVVGCVVGWFGVFGYDGDEDREEKVE